MNNSCIKCKKPILSNLYFTFNNRFRVCHGCYFEGKDIPFHQHIFLREISSVETVIKVLNQLKSTKCFCELSFHENNVNFKIDDTYFHKSCVGINKFSVLCDLCHDPNVIYFTEKKILCFKCHLETNRENMFLLTCDVCRNNVSAPESIKSIICKDHTF